MANLKLGPLPKLGTARMTITLPEPLKEELERYAAEYSRLYEPVEAAALIPHMIEAFIRSDRGYRSRKAQAARGQNRQREVGTASRTTRSESGGDSA
ncbi:DUF2274 domain-containing protein [Mesorhizobium sp. M5C.F.Ca.IN.020.32.2.1]|uniref:DUF2274 domain-containing protein n=1 Tax=Mesorhizobium sp. M5C.F.Ca.IN.020.32.2.1 TaxID=2496771 RepID=UPI000FD581A9|nr:DUF2274 domain-containing protein [Mesorhizobium sp. M5C.F.Ca.IN.020.32.2.1]RUV32465.1 DUF2274 domain-containing protein [Mesorhizobium sp. M5C.F.Ca.IN.020.32.2.1]